MSLCLPRRNVEERRSSSTHYTLRSSRFNSVERTTLNKRMDRPQSRSGIQKNLWFAHAISQLQFLGRSASSPVNTKTALLWCKLHSNNFLNNLIVCELANSWWQDLCSVKGQNCEIQFHYGISYKRLDTNRKGEKVISVSIKSFNGISTIWNTCVWLSGQRTGF